MVVEKGLERVLQEALKQPVLRKWNLKRKKVFGVHKDFCNWEYGRREKLECTYYIMRRAYLASKVDGTGWNAGQKAVYVISKRMAPRNWMEQNLCADICWDNILFLSIDGEEFDKNLEIFKKRMRYDYTKEEYPYGR
jgi:hypothetical protein